MLDLKRIEEDLEEFKDEKEFNNFMEEIEKLTVNYVDGLLACCKGYRHICPNDFLLFLYELKDFSYSDFNAGVEQFVEIWNSNPIFPTTMVMKEQPEEKKPNCFDVFKKEEKKMYVS